MKVNKEPWARTKWPHGPNIQIRCQCQGDKKGKEKKKHTEQTKRDQEILLCLPLM
jgi:hypothetical protein